MSNTKENLKIDLPSDGALTTEQQHIIEEYDRESKVRRLESPLLKKIFYFLAIVVSLYHLYTAAFGTPVTLKHRSLHVAFMLVMAFVLYPMGKKFSFKKLAWFDWIFIALSISVAVYVWVDYLGIIERAGNANMLDTVFATILVLVVLEASRRASGWALPILSLVFIAYALFGRNIPGMFKHRGYNWIQLANHLFANTEGIYGTSVNVASSYIFLFILFGSVMNKSGMGQFFNDIAMAIAGGTKGGPAKVSVIASGLLGSINGSAVANVVTTGAFTIPLMKKTGYSKEFAGAVESTASVGGQLLPPVMGAAAFIMAEMLGMKYSEIAIAAAIPALIYYLGIILQVHMRACKLGLVGLSKDNLPKVGKVMKEDGYLLIPILFLLGMLFFSGVTVIYAAFYTIIVTIIVSITGKAVKRFKKEGHGIKVVKQFAKDMGKEILDAFDEGARSTVSVALSCACVGIVVGVISKTGFGLNMAKTIISLGQKNLIFTLLFTMITCMILGMGVPSIPAYIITATIAAPALVDLGIPALAAHMFAFYFAMFANLTPPVALAAFAAAGISGGNPMKTGYASVKLAISGFIVPYMFVLNNQLLLLNTDLLTAVTVAFLACLGVFMIAISIEGYWLKKMILPLRILCFLGAFGLMDYSSHISTIIGLVVFVVVALVQVLLKKRDSSQAA